MKSDGDGTMVRTNSQVSLTKGTSSEGDATNAILPAAPRQVIQKYHVEDIAMNAAATRTTAAALLEIKNDGPQIFRLSTRQIRE